MSDTWHILTFSSIGSSALCGISAYTKYSGFWRAQLPPLGHHTCRLEEVQPLLRKFPDDTLCPACALLALRE